MRILIGTALVSLFVAMTGPSVCHAQGIATLVPTFTNGVITTKAAAALTTPKGTINGYDGVCAFGTLGPRGVVKLEGYATALLDGNVPGTWYVISISPTPPAAAWLVTPTVMPDHHLAWRRWGYQYGTQGGHKVIP